MGCRGKKFEHGGNGKNKSNEIRAEIKEIENSKKRIKDSAEPNIKKHMEIMPIRRMEDVGGGT